MENKIGIILNGATGRICSNQHLGNALAAICAEGGLEIAGDTFIPEIILVGRKDKELRKIAKLNKILWFFQRSCKG